MKYSWLLALVCAFCTALTVDAKIIQEQDTVGLTVKDGFGKPIAAQVKVVYVHDDAITTPKPILILNHGRSYKPELRAALEPIKAYGANARWFAQIGFFVVVPTRIGYGATGGEDVEDSGACQKKIYQPGFDAAADQTLKIVEHVRQRSDVNRERTVILGQSYGGTTAIAAAALNPDNVQAFVNFAGGAGGNPETQAQRPCSPQLIERMFAGYGKTARTPSLWIYAENDQYFGPTYPKEWFDAFVRAGAPAQYKLFGPHGADGHPLFTSSAATWQPRVAEFLQSRGFADLHWSEAMVENLLNAQFRSQYAATRFAAIDNVAAVPGLNENCRKRYQEWLKTPAPKGFAVAADGGCGFSSGTRTTAAALPTDPAERALVVCQRVKGRACRLYAIDDQVVWTSP